MSGNLTTLGVNAGEAATITYESAVDANGDVVAVNGFAPLGPAAPGDPPDYEAGFAHKYGTPTTGTGSGVITYNFSGPWTAAQEAQITADLMLWEDVANVQFEFVASTNPDDAQETFQDDTNPTTDNDGTHTEDYVGSSTAVTGTSTIAQVSGGNTNVQTTEYYWSDVSSFTVADGYGITTIVHEIGHVLGLAHTGDYNADGDLSGTYTQLSPYDSQQWSVMSYISPTDASQPYFDQSAVTGTDWNGGTPQTMMPLDILAVQRLYGAQTDGPLSGGQVFGFNCNVAGPSVVFFDFTKNTTPIVTLWDSGDDNTLDLSGWSSVATIDLRPGHFSSADGLINNIGIGFGVTIDTAIGTLGSTTFVVNDDSDRLVGSPNEGDTAVFADPDAGWRETQIGSLTSTWTGGSATDTLVAVSSIMFTGGGDTIASSTAGDALTVTGGQNEVFLQSSIGAFLTASGADTIVADKNGNDSVYSNSTVGGPGDLIFEQPGAEMTYHGAGATDTIIATNAQLLAGSGGVLAFEQGAGAQVDLNGSVGASTVVGNSTGSIRVTGGDNGVDVGGGAGANLIELNGQSAVAFAGGNNDSVYSDTYGGTSYIIGSVGNELLDARGGGGEQVIYAGSGNDTLAGGTGTNVFAVGSGNATVVGDQGVNVFEIQAGVSTGNLTIDDYNANDDYFGIFGFGALGTQIGYDDASGTRANGAGNLVFALGDNTTITLVGVTSVGDQSHFFGG